MIEGTITFIFRKNFKYFMGMLSNFSIKLSTNFCFVLLKKSQKYPTIWACCIILKIFKNRWKMCSCVPQLWGNLRQNRYVIITLKTTNTIAIWSGVLLHTQNNIFYTEPENRNKHFPGWSLLQSVWRNLNNYILQQNILASGKLFTKIFSRAHENK